MVQALKLANRKQRELLEKNYGRRENSNVVAVKTLYNELGLKKIYEDYEEESYCKINELITDLKDIPEGVFRFLLEKIYKRNK